MQLLVLLSGELASIKVNKKKTREYFQQQEKIGFTVCVFDFFFNAEIGERSCDSSPDTRFQCSTGMWFYVYLILCVCDVDPDIHKGQNNVLF